MIKALICNFQLDIAAVEAQWDVDFASYFAEDLKLLAPLAHDGLVAVDDKVIQVTAVQLIVPPLLRERGKILNNP